jgi:signal transduction histidine kinase
VRPLRMRTTMLVSLLLVAIAMTGIFLVLVRLTVQRQITNDLAEDTKRSEATFANLQTQRRHLLERTAALMADLPSLKALMTARDVRTIEDGGAEFWRVSGSSLFALSDQNGRMVSLYNDGAPLERDAVQGSLTQAVEHPGTPQFVIVPGRLIEVLSKPIEFGSADAGFRLGYVTVGYSLDRELAKEVGEAASAQVLLIGRGSVVASTLDAVQEEKVAESVMGSAKPEGSEVWVDNEHFLTRTIPLTASAASDGGPYLLVLKSFAPAARTLRQLNLGIVVTGVFGLLIGSVLAASIARTVTRPLESLLEGTRALGAGDFRYELQESGALEVRGLSQSFRRMQAEIERTQRELLFAERMATIGRMASSISHDLRHYLTSMYANAEFLSMEGTSATARVEMLDEVKTAVVGMTDLLDSLLVFGRTGMALQTRTVELKELVERAAARVMTHPEARNVDVSVNASETVQVTADPQELDRAIYNVLLNGCQAARRGASCGRVDVTVTDGSAEDGGDLVLIRIEDNGPGVPFAIRETLFQPFVSEGKEHGTGLGLALSCRVMEAHGGSLRLEETGPGSTIFCLTLPVNSIEESTYKTRHFEGLL